MLLPGRSGSSFPLLPGLGERDTVGFNISKLSGPKAENLGSEFKGGGRGDTDLRVGILRVGPLDERLLTELCAYPGLGAGLTARGLMIGADS